MNNKPIYYDGSTLITLYCQRTCEEPCNKYLVYLNVPRITDIESRSYIIVAVSNDSLQLINPTDLIALSKLPHEALALLV